MPDPPAPVTTYCTLAELREWAARTRDVSVHGCVVCCEVLEHTPAWREIVTTAHRHMKPDALLLVTCATDPRAPHSATDGGQVRDGEFYGNIAACDMEAQLAVFASAGVETHADRGDLYAWAIK